MVVVRGGGVLVSSTVDELVDLCRADAERLGSRPSAPAEGAFLFLLSSSRIDIDIDGLGDPLRLDVSPLFKGLNETEDT